LRRRDVARARRGRQIAEIRGCPNEAVKATWERMLALGFIPVSEMDTKLTRKIVSARDRHSLSQRNRHFSTPVITA